MPVFSSRIVQNLPRRLLSYRHSLTFALETLSEDAVEHGAAVVAERRRGVRARLEAVRHVELEPLSHQL